MVFREARRVLRDDGVLWLNLGDSYAQARGRGHWETGGIGDDSGQKVSRRWENMDASDIGLKPKDLVGIPWRVALALQADGWWLRSVCPWIKWNPMPESVRDRPTMAHEYIFLLSKSEQYFYDAEAIRSGSIADHGSGCYVRKGSKQPGNAGQSTGVPWEPQSSRNRRTSDWWDESLDTTIDMVDAYLTHLRGVRQDGGMLMGVQDDPLGLSVNTAPYGGAHFAVFPPKLVDPMVLSGTSSEGCCTACGAPWQRVIERTKPPDFGRGTQGWSKGAHQPGNTYHRNAGSGGFQSVVPKPIGWDVSCRCNAPTYPCTVLDPFSGSGTVGHVALRMGRNYIGIDLNPDYLDLAEGRIRGEPPPSGSASPLTGSVMDLFGDES